MEKCTLDKVTGISKAALHFQSAFQFYKDFIHFPPLISLQLSL